MHSPRSVCRRLLAPALVVVAATILAVGGQARDGRYLDAIKQARVMCLRASPGDREAAAMAVSVLRQGTGASQLEVLRALQGDPPAFTEAADRLLTVQQALEHPASPPDAPRAASDLRSILSEARYQANGPSPFDRVKAWLLGQLARLLLFATGSSGGIARLVEFAVAAAVVTGAVVFLARATWSRRGGPSAAAIAPSGRRQAVDWFSEADRLAAGGDYPAALRALTSGVATAVGGQEAWEMSPLTVRELLARSPAVDLEGPLLFPFEASAYGHRPTDAAIYAKAAAVAAGYRAPGPT